MQLKHYYIQFVDEKTEGWWGESNFHKVIGSQSQ